MEINLSDIPPISTILVIAGIIFLLLSVAKSIGTKIIVNPQNQKISAVIGVILLVAGIGINYLPGFIPSPFARLGHHPP